MVTVVIQSPSESIGSLKVAAVCSSHLLASHSLIIIYACSLVNKPLFDHSKQLISHWQYLRVVISQQVWLMISRDESWWIICMNL